MKNLFLPLAIISTIMFVSSCNQSHDNGGHSHEIVEESVEPLAFTIYTDKTELFVEFKPLVLGKESRFAAHFTEIGEYFKAFEEGNITLTIEAGGKTTSVTATEPQVPGIF